MFTAGYFSADSTEPYQVNAAGLNRLSVGQLAIGLQVSDSNPLAGLEGRAGLLTRLAEALQNSEYFGASQRPGNMLGEDSASSSSIKAHPSRLPPVPPVHAILLRPRHHHSHPLERPHRRSCQHLASFPNTGRRHLPRRRMALLFNALTTPRSTVGEHRTLPQTDTMAVLLLDGSYDEAHEHPIRRR